MRPRDDSPLKHDAGYVVCLAGLLAMGVLLFLLRDAKAPEPPPVQMVECKHVKVPTRVDWYVGGELVGRMECKT